MHCGEGVATLSRVSARTPVLVVDDDASVRELLRRVLEMADFEVTLAASEAEALDALGQAPMAVVVDVHLPTGNGGLWLVDEIRTRAPGTAVLIITGDCAIAEADSPRRDVVAYLVKPFTNEALLEAMTAAVEWTRTARA